MKLKAKKTRRGRKKLRSKLEGYAWDALKKAGVKFQYEPYSILIFEGFELPFDCWEKSGKKYRQAKKVRDITYTPDFVGKKFLIETKGYRTPQSRLRWKLIQKWFADNKPNWTLFMPSNQKEVDLTIEIILKNKLG